MVIPGFSSRSVHREIRAVGPAFAGANVSGFDIDGDRKGRKKARVGFLPPSRHFRSSCRNPVPVSPFLTAMMHLFDHFSTAACHGSGFLTPSLVVGWQC